MTSRLAQSRRQMEPAVHKRNLELKGFKEVKEIGRGTFGIVFKCYSNVDGQFYAVKCVRKAECGAEAELLNTIDHENIIKLYDSWTEYDVIHSEINVDTAPATNLVTEENSARQSEGTDQEDEIIDLSGLGITLTNHTDIEDDEPSDDGFQRTIQNNDLSDKGNSSLSCGDAGDSGPRQHQDPGSCQEKPEDCYLYMKLELCDGTLADLLFGRSNCDPMQLRAMYASVVKGVACLHSKNIVHLDLKPENIFTKNQLIRAGDQASVTGKTTLKIADLGNSRFLKKLDELQFQMAVDMHALGKLAVSMLLRTSSDDQTIEICKKIRDSHYYRESGNSFEFELIKKMFTEHIENCISAEEVLRCLSGRDIRPRTMIA